MKSTVYHKANEECNTQLRLLDLLVKCKQLLPVQYMYTGLNTKNWESEWRREGPAAVECNPCGFMLWEWIKETYFNLLFLQ